MILAYLTCTVMFLNGVQIIGMTVTKAHPPMVVNG